MTNPDISTLNGSLEQLGITMADNLVTMGVSNADPSDGLTTLASKILSVPGGGGLDLDTAVSLSSSSASITLGQSVTLTSVLSTSYDSTVDLEGVLIGGTVSFKNGNTVIGTDSTDSSGEATYTYTPVSAGTYTLKAVFAGTSDFDACESSTVNVVVTQPVTPASVTIASDKSILSYYDSESATLSATVLDSSDNPIEGVTVTFYNGTTSIGTADTNSSGVATKSYSSTGAGDLTFKAEVGSLVSETYSIEDCVVYRDIVSNSDSFNVPLPNHFVCTSIINRSSSSNSYCYPILTNYQFGVLREKGSLSIRIGNGNPFADNNTTIVPLNTDTLMTYTYDNGFHSLNANNVTVTGTETTYAIGYLTRVNIQRYTVNEFKIKAL